jgi:hypothetical protein
MATGARPSGGRPREDQPDRAGMGELLPGSSRVRTCPMKVRRFEHRDKNRSEVVRQVVAAFLKLLGVKMLRRKNCESR